MRLILILLTLIFIAWQLTRINHTLQANNIVLVGKDRSQPTEPEVKNDTVPVIEMDSDGTSFLGRRTIEIKK